MTRKLICALSLAICVLFVACKKDKDTRIATIVDTGDISYLGCGYLLKLENDELLKPVTLPGAFQHNGISVKVKYNHTGIIDTCKYGSVLYDLVNIQEIKLNQ